MLWCGQVLCSPLPEAQSPATPAVGRSALIPFPGKEEIMMPQTPLIPAPRVPSPAVFRLSSRGAGIQVSYEELFQRAYELHQTARFETAGSLFEALSSRTDRGPRAHILLALCRARQQRYADCIHALSAAFNPADGTASRLHEAFVFWTCGLYQDVRQILLEVVRDRKDLPTPCLLLADLLDCSGNRKRPPVLWQLAMQRDRHQGAIRRIATDHLQRWRSLHGSS